MDFESQGPKSRSRDIAKNTRIWPSIMTTSTLVMPATAPIAITAAPHLKPANLSASATGAWISIFDDGISPVSTAATAI